MATVRVESRFKELKRELDKQLRTRAEIALQIARNEILETLSGDRTGRVYRVPGTKRTYVASAPGEPPAVMLGHLRQEILTEIQETDTEIVAAIGSPLPYSLRLELGDSRMAPRPWLRPSLQRAVPKIQAKIGERWF